MASSSTASEARRTDSRDSRCSPTSGKAGEEDAEDADTLPLVHSAQPTQPVAVDGGWQLSSTLPRFAVLLLVACLAAGVGLLAGLALASHAEAGGSLAVADYAVDPPAPPPSPPPASLTSPWPSSSSSLNSSSSSSPSAASASSAVSQPLTSDMRGYVAVLYTGTVRAMSLVFASQLLHLVCSSPYTVHLFFSIMVLDSGSDHLSAKATLDRYDSCQNLDGEWVSVGAAVKGWQLRRQADLPAFTEFEAITRHYVHMRRKPQENMLLQLWNFRQAGLLLSTYQEQSGVDYAWVLKMRPDSLQQSDVWQSLFTVSLAWDFITGHDLAQGEGEEQTLNQTAVAALNHRLRLLQLQPQPLPDRSLALAMAGEVEADVRSYLVGEFVFTPRASSSELQGTDCDHFGGVNDQFAASNASVMHAYFRRGYEPYQSLIIARSLASPDGDFVDGTERWLRTFLLALNIPLATLTDLCYRVYRTNHSPEPVERHHNHLRPPTECHMLDYGVICCDLACPLINARNERWKRTTLQLSSDARESRQRHADSLLRLLDALSQAEDAALDWTGARKRLTSLLDAWQSASSPLPHATEAAGGWGTADWLPAGSSAALVSDTPASTVEWLASEAALDDARTEQRRFDAYSRHQTLAVELLTAAQRGQSGVREEGAALWQPLTFSRVGFSRYGSAVGSMQLTCKRAEVGPWQQVEQLWSTLRLSSNPQHWRRFHQHEVCTGKNVNFGELR